MPKVNVRYYGFIRQPAGNKSREEVEIAKDMTLRDLLNLLADRYGNRFRDHLLNEDGSLMGGPVVISVDGTTVHGLDVPIAGDSNVEIAVIAMIAGG